MRQRTGFLRPNRSRAFALHIVSDAGLVLGGALALVSLIAIAQDHGGLGYDTPSYWHAGRHVMDGAPLYNSDPYTTLALYTYPPLFAQLFVLPALLPELLVAWLWRASSVFCLRYLTGSWRATVVCCLFIPVLTELSINNVTLQLAAILIFAMRDKRGAYLLPWAAMIKFGPALIVPYLWLRKPETRRPLVIGTVVFLAACLVSIVVAPRDWSDYVDMLRFQNVTALSGQGVINLIPSGGGIDFVARFGLATVVALLAAYWRRGWLAYAAASITCPVMAFSRFAPLVGLWQFRPGSERAQAADRTAAVAGTPE
ncbi:MAG: glycosyltransferase family 87 protein [Candidatus Limnocylindrales bacterium]